MLPEASPILPKVMELEKISTILSDNANIYELVAQDIGRADHNHNTGANGMTLEQVVYAAIYMKVPFKALTLESLSSFVLAVV